MWPETMQLNASVCAIAAGDDRVSYIDVATPMLNKDGSPNESLFASDMLQMSQAGYDIRRDVVAPVLKKGSSYATRVGI